MSFRPHIASRSDVKEFTFRALFIGIILGLFFAVANAYLALKIGTTISASIPAAIISMALMKTFFRSGTILENNIVQTVATVGEALAGGIVFTIPALILLGEDPTMGRVFLLSVLGGILGILFMIPMRRYIIVEEHKQFPFPEGTACAEILKAGEKTRRTSIMALWGIFSGIVYKLCTSAFFLWKEIPIWTFNFFRGTIFAIDATPALLGVGYIIGPRVASLMFAGGALAWWVFIPLIKTFGLGNVIVYPATIAIENMNSAEIWSTYIRYIGAGTIAVGGIAGLVRILPLLNKTFRASFKELLNFRQKEPMRTDRDISLTWLILGSLAVILTLWLFPGMPMNFVTIILLVILSFIFVGVTCMTVGIIGTTSNPVSGMTITTLLLTCIIFVLLGWTERIYLISAITMGAVACTAIAMAGTTAQDLKAGFLLGATPKSQQIAEIIGVFVPSLCLGYTIYLLNSAYHIGSVAMPAPQATLLSMIAKGVISGDLPYGLVGLGVIAGITMLILRVPVLPFAIGLYLPLSLSVGIVLGGLVRAFVNARASSDVAQEKGILFSSGLVGGDACTGVVIAMLTILGILPTDSEAQLPQWATLVAYFLLAAFLGIMTLKREKRA
ncbi:MAG: oligopeptide transporter, OPT family [Chlamydiia bacterium]|nr:oligopeptide transporter, OPT family [Chlamydiia bacterium]